MPNSSSSTSLRASSIVVPSIVVTSSPFHSAVIPSSASETAASSSKELPHGPLPEQPAGLRERAAGRDAVPGLNRPARRRQLQQLPSSQCRGHHSHRRAEQPPIYAVDRGLAGCCSQRKTVELESLIPSASGTDFETEAKSG